MGCTRLQGCKADEIQLTLYWGWMRVWLQRRTLEVGKSLYDLRHLLSGKTVDILSAVEVGTNPGNLAIDEDGEAIR